MIEQMNPLHLFAPEMVVIKLLVFRKIDCVLVENQRQGEILPGFIHFCFFGNFIDRLHGKIAQSETYQACIQSTYEKQGITDRQKALKALVHGLMVRVQCFPDGPVIFIDQHQAICTDHQDTSVIQAIESLCIDQTVQLDRFRPVSLQPF
ncbi:hypothetical protein D3C86_1448640 [compost metagenome]